MPSQLVSEKSPRASNEPIFGDTATFFGHCYYAPPQTLIPVDLLDSSQPLMSRFDRTGLYLSGACMVHCAALPLVALLLPSVGGVVFDHSSLLHWLLLGLAVPVSGYALLRGYRQHQRFSALALGLVGLLVMTLGVSHLLSHSLEIPLTLVGATVVAVSHLLNIRLITAQH